MPVSEAATGSLTKNPIYKRKNDKKVPGNEPNVSQYPQNRVSWYEHFRHSWPVLLSIGCGLLWVGRTVQSPEQIDSSISIAISPLRERQDWLEAEILRTEQQQANWQAFSHTMTMLQERVKFLESRQPSNQGQ